jgi:hypothetical protein
MLGVFALFRGFGELFWSVGQYNSPCLCAYDTPTGNGNQGVWSTCNKSVTKACIKRKNPENITKYVYFEGISKLSAEEIMLQAV